MSVKIELPSPSFEYRAFVADSFDDLLDQHVSRGQPLHDEALLEEAFRIGRVLVQARAGAGKTTILRRLQMAATDRGMLVIAVDLVALSPMPSNADGDELSQALLDRSGITESRMSAVDRCLVTLDAVNEAPREITDLVFAAADHLASRHPNTAVVVTDRLTRRSQAESSRWLLCGVSPVDRTKVRELIGREPGEAEADLLGLPLYLNLALPTRELVARSEAFAASLAAVRSIAPTSTDWHRLLMTLMRVDAGLRSMRNRSGGCPKELASHSSPPASSSQRQAASDLATS